MSFDEFPPGRALEAGELLPADTDSRPTPEFKVPGASAPTFEGAAIFDMSLQHLLKSRSRL